MIAQRIFSSGYSRYGVSFFLSVATAYFGSVASGQAQVDPNIQTQVNILAPPVITVPLEPIPNSVPESKMVANFLKIFPKNLCPPTEKQIRAALPPKLAAKFDATSLQTLTETELSLIKAKLVQSPDFTSCHGQPTAVKASLQFNPTYETNALKSGHNGSWDTSSNVGGGVQVTAGLGDKRPYDLIFLNTQSASARYSTFTAKSVDTLTVQAGYQYLLAGYDEHGKIPVDGSYSPTSKAITFDTLSFGVLNQTIFTPTFQQRTADLFTPQVTLARQNINLADSKTPCPGATKPPSPSDNFCYYMDVSLTVGQTFSAVSTLQNANVAVSATVGKRFTPEWTLAGQAMITSRAYENVPGGRQDFLLQSGPLLTYAPAPTMTSFGKTSIAFS
ncbi:MAG TPA: hypothetical protein VKT76_16325, partial [Bradyrhizobium sp.]|nr:hypothetical protein [Bradyrhizobium sp.]